jgi:hypothetical protein
VRASITTVRAPQVAVHAPPLACAALLVCIRPLFIREYPPTPCCHLRLHLTCVHLLHLFEMLAWKSTSHLPMPCQPIVLTGNKTKKQIWACDSVFTQTRPIVDRHIFPSDRPSLPYRTSLSPCPSFMTTLIHGTNRFYFKFLIYQSSTPLLGAFRIVFICKSYEP